MKYFVGLCFLMCSVVPSFGTTINFATPTGDQGTTQTYGVITATAYGSNSPDLYGKNDSGDEKGLGLTTDSDHEITAGHYIQLDVTSLQGLTISFIMNSSTGSDAWKVFESSTGSATTGTSIMMGSDENSHSITIGSGIKYLGLHRDQRKRVAEFNHVYRYAGAVILGAHGQRTVGSGPLAAPQNRLAEGRLISFKPSLSSPAAESRDRFAAGHHMPH